MAERDYLWGIFDKKILGLIGSVGFGFAIAVIAIAISSALGFGLFSWVKASTEQDVPIIVSDGPLFLAIAVLAVLIVVLVVGTLSRYLADAGLQNHAHAMALPAGSIRSIIALGFLVLFAVLSVYAVEKATPRYEPFGEPRSETFKPTSVDPDTTEREEELANRIEAIKSDIAVELGTRDFEISVAGKQKARNAAANDPVILRVQVYQLVVAEQAAEIAREVLTIVGTALTVIVGFYFGARANAGREASRTPAVKDPVLERQVDEPQKE